MVKEFRSISLITSVYMILAKSLADQLRKVLSSTIFEVRGAFFTRRQILDQALVANEASEEYRSKN